MPRIKYTEWLKLAKGGSGLLGIKNDEIPPPQTNKIKGSGERP